jgi:hypothetical protein
VRLTRSEPWDAPEWSHAQVRLADAKKMDVYSFGLLCLWIFFHDEFLENWGYPSISLGRAFSLDDTLAFEDLQYRKRTGNHILHLAQKMTDQHETYKPDTKARLRRVFALTLEDAQEARAGTIEDLAKILRGDENLP